MQPSVQLVGDREERKYKLSLSFKECSKCKNGDKLYCSKNKCNPYVVLVAEGDMCKHACAVCGGSRSIELVKAT